MNSGVIASESRLFRGLGGADVRGDLIVLSEGDRVPADAVLLQCQDLQADESMLTGESVPVRKIARDDCGEPQANPPGGDDLPEVISGSLIVRGTGLAEVIAIGSRRPRLDAWRRDHRVGLP
jgi:Ca2+-transporting ATPase